MDSSCCLSLEARICLVFSHSDGNKHVMSVSSCLLGKGLVAAWAEKNVRIDRLCLRSDGISYALESAMNATHGHGGFFLVEEGSHRVR